MPKITLKLKGKAKELQTSPEKLYIRFPTHLLSRNISQLCEIASTSQSVDTGVVSSLSDADVSAANLCNLCSSLEMTESAVTASSQTSRFRLSARENECFLRMRATQKNYVERNSDEIRKRQRERNESEDGRRYQRQYRVEHDEDARQYRVEHAEDARLYRVEHAEDARNYRAEHQEEQRVYQREYRQRQQENIVPDVNGSLF